MVYKSVRYRFTFGCSQCITIRNYYYYYHHYYSNGKHSICSKKWKCLIFFNLLMSMSLAECMCALDLHSACSWCRATQYTWHTIAKTSLINKTGEKKESRKPRVGKRKEKTTKYANTQNRCTNQSECGAINPHFSRIHLCNDISHKLI